MESDMHPFKPKKGMDEGSINNKISARIGVKAQAKFTNYLRIKNGGDAKENKLDIVTFCKKYPVDTILCVILIGFVEF